ARDNTFHKGIVWGKAAGGRRAADRRSLDPSRPRPADVAGRGEGMRTLRRWLVAEAAGLGLALAALSGCQTHGIEANMVLPSGHYLQHYPQYIPETPPFPLPREAANLADAALGPPVAAPR